MDSSTQDTSDSDPGRGRISGVDKDRIHYPTRVCPACTGHDDSDSPPYKGCHHCDGTGRVSLTEADIIQRKLAAARTPHVG